MHCFARDLLPLPVALKIPYRFESLSVFFQGLKSEGKGVQKMRVAIVEDQRAHLERLAFILREEPEVELVGTYCDGESAIENIASVNVDVLICDLGLPGITGNEVVAKFKAQHPKIEVMAYTVSEDSDSILAALKAGVTSYLLKDSSPAEIIKALWSLYRGGSPLSPKVARALIVEFRSESEKPQPYLLTNKEKEVLTKIDLGFTYKETALDLSVSINTINFHIKNIYDKLNVKCKYDALDQARLKGILA